MGIINLGADAVSILESEPEPMSLVFEVSAYSFVYATRWQWTFDSLSLYAADNQYLLIINNFKVKFVGSNNNINRVDLLDSTFPLDPALIPRGSVEVGNNGGTQTAIAPRTSDGCLTLGGMLENSPGVLTHWTPNNNVSLNFDDGSIIQNLSGQFPLLYFAFRDIGGGNSRFIANLASSNIGATRVYNFDCENNWTTGSQYAVPKLLVYG